MADVDWAELARKMTLVMNHTLEKIDTASEIKAIELEQLIKDRLAAGISREEIMQELIRDLDQNIQGMISRHWGTFASDMKNIVYGAEQEARSLGMQMALGNDPQAMYRWQTNGVNVCEDCLPRHGQVDTLENWIRRGMPQEWGSRCGVNCQCTLVAEELELEPIQIGQE